MIECNEVFFNSLFLAGFIAYIPWCVGGTYAKRMQLILIRPEMTSGLSDYENINILMW